MQKNFVQLYSTCIRIPRYLATIIIPLLYLFFYPFYLVDFCSLFTFFHFTFSYSNIAFFLPFIPSTYHLFFGFNSSFWSFSILVVFHFDSPFLCNFYANLTIAIVLQRYCECRVYQNRMNNEERRGKDFWR